MQTKRPNKPSKKYKKQNTLMQKGRPKRKKHPPTVKKQISQERRKKNRTSRKKRKQPQKAKKKLKKGRKKQKLVVLLGEIGLTIIIFSVLLSVLLQFFLAFPKVNGYAMSPALNDGKRVVAVKKSEIRRYDLVYFTVPDRENELTNIRRVIGLPGEQIEYVDETLYVNGEAKVESFLQGQVQDAEENGYTLTEDFLLTDIPGLVETTIPEGYYLVLGDNRTFSVDSRSYGLVSEKNMIGTIKMIF